MFQMQEMHLPRLHGTFEEAKRSVNISNTLVAHVGPHENSYYGYIFQGPIRRS